MSQIILNHVPVIPSRTRRRTARVVPDDEITLADVIRVVDGPLANVRGLRPERLEYTGPATPLLQVWIALRANMRAVLEQVTLEDLVRDSLRAKMPAEATSDTQGDSLMSADLRAQRIAGDDGLDPNGLLPDLLDDCSRGLMRDVASASNGPQPFALDPLSDLRPSLPRVAWFFGHRGVPPDSRSSSRVQESLRMNKRDQGPFHDVYLS